MAINFVVSYSFSPSTTISSSQVNTNFSDEAAVWQGLEAKTKSFAALQLDATPTAAADVVRKDYVDNYSTYRRPVLQFGSVTTVTMETGINGTSGQARILFPDGSLRTDSTTLRINLDTSRTAALSGTAQSGIRSGTGASNTWYACYAVKTSDNSSNFVMVADTVLPLQANFATLNSNFGSNSWVYLGMIRNGDNNGNTTSLIRFVQSGSMTIFRSPLSGINGLLLTSGSGVTTLTYSISAGTGVAQIPDNLKTVCYGGQGSSATTNFTMNDQAGNTVLAFSNAASNTVQALAWMTSDPGANLTSGAGANLKIFLYGFYDPVLGVGSNPIL